MSLISQIVDIADTVKKFALDLIDRFDNGLLDFLKWLLDSFVLLLQMVFYKILYWIISFVWGIIDSLLAAFDFTGLIQDALNNIPGGAGALLAVMGFPEFLNIIIIAVGIKLIVKIIPFI